jgi:hypothetical protein
MPGPRGLPVGPGTALRAACPGQGITRGGAVGLHRPGQHRRAPQAVPASRYSRRRADGHVVRSSTDRRVAAKLGRSLHGAHAEPQRPALANALPTAYRLDGLVARAMGQDILPVVLTLRHLLKRPESRGGGHWWPGLDLYNEGSTDAGHEIDLLTRKRAPFGSARSSAARAGCRSSKPRN